MRDDSQDYRHLFVHDLPLLDVRAPVEFAKGAFPGAVNMPLLDDEQRAAVGTRYKDAGQDAAIELGWSLATPAIKAQRQRDWLAFGQAHPDGYLYCFRGGLRSRLAQELLAEAGLRYPRVLGGYKAMRRFLIDELEANCQRVRLVLVSGRTGSGKTQLLPRIHRALDLEGLARHRGSAFGRRLAPQPAQIDFENAVSIGLLKLMDAGAAPLFVEDESKLIGHVALPLNVKARMQTSPLAVLETPTEARVELSLADYVTDAWPEYLAHFGDQETAETAFREQILGNLARIQKRLGGERFEALHRSFSQALDRFFSSGDADPFRPGIATLLTDYYDPMYDYQQTRREGQVLFRGPADELVAWANDYIEKTLATGEG